MHDLHHARRYDSAEGYTCQECFMVKCHYTHKNPSHVHIYGSYPCDGQMKFLQLGS